MARILIVLLAIVGLVGQSSMAATTSSPAWGHSKPLLFVSSKDLSAAKRYRQLVIKKYDQLGKLGAVALAAKASAAWQNKSFRAASGYYARAIALKPESFPYWSGLARTILRAPTNRGERRPFLKIGLNAAINAYQNAATLDDRAQALELIAHSYQARKNFRPALQAYKASLLLNNSLVVQQDYVALRAVHGFRMLRYTVNTEAASPRICLQFSEDLLTNQQYESYVTIDGKTPTTLVRESRQLCVDGLQHGVKYHIGLRSGLPSSVAEVITKPIALDVYIRDRKPALRFSGSRYLLPRIGSKGIPLVSVNTAMAALQLYRIGDRGLSSLVEGRRFLQALDFYSLKDLNNRLTTKVWQGELEIASQRNREVTTLFPVSGVLPGRQPGVYVLIATPAGAATKKWQAQATQWFVVSDIGLTTLSGNDGLHVFARSLATAEPLAGVELQLLARSNEVLSTLKTDSQGYVRFPVGLIRGQAANAPKLLLARSEEGDFVLADLSKPGFDLSDRGVGGRKAPGPLDLFVYTDRGIYRAGETIHLNALLRDRSLQAATGLPLTVKFARPDGKLAARRVLKESGAGAHALSWSLPANAMQGNWQIAFYLDEAQQPLARKRILVEDFVPDQMEFTLSSQTKLLRKGALASLALSARYLYGAPASGLRPEGEVRFTPVHRLADYPEYFFGLDGETPFSARANLQGLTVTDAAGNSVLQFGTDQLAGSIGPMRADVSVRLRETGGRVVERNITVPVAAGVAQIGLRAGFEQARVTQGATATFSVITIDGEGKRSTIKGLKWSLLRLERRYQWYSRGSGWQYEPVISSVKVASGVIDSSQDRPVQVSVTPTWGRYRLEVILSGAEGQPGAKGAASSMLFSSGWYVDSTSTETPDGLEIALDKQRYAPDAVAHLRISPYFSGKAMVVVGNSRLLWKKMFALNSDGTDIAIPVSRDWGTGAYVTVFAYRDGGGALSHMPARAIGVQWLAIEPMTHRLQLTLGPDRQVRPGRSVLIPLQVQGISAGEQAYVTVAAVDVGILNLTAFKAPQPENWYFGQRDLDLAIKDLYGKLIDGMAGTVGRIRSGGDVAGARRLQRSVLRQKPLALFSGIVRVEPDGRARVRFDLPQFTGSLRVMAVAWSNQAVGQATQDIVVRDPVVMLASLPKFLAPGDHSRLQLAIDNSDGAAGEYRLQITGSAFVAPERSSIDRTITLQQGQKRSLSIPIVALKPGAGQLLVKLTHSSGDVFQQPLRVPVRSAQRPFSVRTIQSLTAGGGSLKLDQHAIDGLQPDSANVSVFVTRSLGLDTISLLQALDRYPYRCAEQTTSRALPLLYRFELAATAGLGDRKAIRKRVQKAVNRLASYQSASGSFGMWGPGSDSLWLDAYVSEFLTRARESSFTVPDEVLKLALQNLQNNISYDYELTRRGNEIAYALYVLARNRRASIGDLRYLVEAKFKNIVSPLAKAQLAASLGFYGDTKRSQRAFVQAYAALQQALPKTFSGDDYGSSLRDQAAVLALASEALPVPAFVPELVRQVALSRQAKRITSTQENAWLSLAAGGLQQGNSAIALQVNGVNQSGNFRVQLDTSSLADGLNLTNTSDFPVQAVVTTTGVSSKPLQAGGEDFSITREYYDLQGQRVEVSRLTQNTRLLVVLNINADKHLQSRIVIRDLLPAGLEIVSPHLFASAELKQFSWLKTTAVTHSEFRDDRFIATVRMQSRDEPTITLAYMVRAVSPGRYVHPAAVVEDMYRPYRAAHTAQGKMRVVAAMP